ncbi:uncharacterized protein LOC135926902 [Gordionus sp. m RMFG-2023]|uniref:uncharacterized protein LOC135926902 n=1 Tax=Gordionus sp. m RMFG-2023 TaxID=3053472 RepID=UPI0031FBFBCB
MTLAIREAEVALASDGEKKLIAKTQEEKRQKFAKEMKCAEGMGNVVRMAKQMAKKRHCAKVEGPGCKFGKDEKKRAVKKMKKGKASGLTMVVLEIFKGSKDLGIEWLMNLANQIVTEGTIPEDWRRSIIIPIYKGKGDPLDSGSYRATLGTCNESI